MTHEQYAELCMLALSPDEEFRAKARVWFNRTGDILRTRTLHHVISFRPLLDSPLPRA